jgi:hypothetical protein
MHTPNLHDWNVVTTHVHPRTCNNYGQRSSLIQNLTLDNMKRNHKG